MTAGLLHRAGPPPSPVEYSELWGHHQVVERASGLVVGGIGLFGPPLHGEVELGYGIVPSRRRGGYATEAVCTLVSLAWAHDEIVAVLANTDADNIASQRVVEKAGFKLVDRSDGTRYRMTRPS